LVAVGFRCKKPVNIDDFAFRLWFPLAAICPKNAKQYQIAVSDLALTTKVISARLETLEKTSRASSVSSSDQCNVLFARSLFIRLAPRSSTPPRPDNGPSRRPRITASDAGLLCGNVNPTPGEISPAHHGVLFLDELPEFKGSVLETMRQPLEEGRVTISRAAGTMTFPSQFMLVAAMNPTLDGKMPGESRCSPREIQNYLNRISGPLLDRIDIHVEVPAVKFREITAERTGETSAQIRERVVTAQRRQQERFAGKRNITCNARMGSRELKALGGLDEATLELLKMAMNELKLSARAYDRILKVARTIADLAGSDMLTSDNLSEAIQYRSLDRQLWA
jgi:magnesium chelatase family protein